jgi:hypothetical protein
LLSERFKDNEIGKFDDGFELNVEKEMLDFFKIKP